MWVRSLGWEDPLEEEMAQPTPVFLPGKSHGQRSLAGYSLWGLKELDMTEQAHTYTCTHTHTHYSVHSYPELSTSQAQG